MIEQRQILTYLLIHLLGNFLYLLTFLLIHLLIYLTYLLTYLLTHSVQQSPSWEANWFSVKKFPHLQHRAHLFWTLKTTQKAAVFVLSALHKLYHVVSQVLVTFFSSLSKISCTLLSGLPFPGTSRSQVQPYTLQLNMTLPSNHTFYSLTPRRK